MRALTLAFVLGALAVCCVPWVLRVTDTVPHEELAERVDWFEGRNGRWPEVRATHVAKYPTCAACGGTDELNVHHVKPFWTHPQLELEPNNLITLCRSHHFSVGHDPDGPFGPLRPNWKSANPSVRMHAAQIRRNQKR